MKNIVDKLVATNTGRLSVREPDLLSMVDFKASMETGGDKTFSPLVDYTNLIYRVEARLGTEVHIAREGATADCIADVKRQVQQVILHELYGDIYARLRRGVLELRYGNRKEGAEALEALFEEMSEVMR